MKIIENTTPSRKDLLNKTYSCELSGWEIAAVTVLCSKFAAGSPTGSMRGDCDTVRYEGEKLFPFLKLDALFDGAHFSSDSREKILEI